MARRGYSRFLVFIHLLGDIAILNAAFIFAYIISNRFKPFQDVANEYVLLHIMFNLAWFVVISLLKVTDIDRHSKLENILRNVIQAVLFHALIIFAVVALIKGSYFSRAHLLFTYGLFTGGLFIWRVTFYLSLRNYRKQGANFRNVVIVGAGRVGNEMYRFLTSEDYHGYKFLGFFDDNPEKCLHRSKVLGSINKLKEYTKKVLIDEIFIALPLSSSKTIRDIITHADNNLIRVKILPDFRGFFNKKVNIEFYDLVPVLTIRPEPLENLWNRVMKRSFDIIFSGMVLLFVFPWLLPIMIVLIKLSSPGPIFFIQKRSGRNNEVFSCFKFRSMAVNENADNMQAMEEDPRITWIGHMLRKTNLDEVPQFINVFLGNMSIVGPRPHMLKHTEDYSKIIDKFMVRQLVKPGITGLAQVNGYRGPTSNKRRMYKRVLYDVWYIEHWNLMLDIKIIYLTIYNMLKGEKNAF